jgi:hypothetical protein
MIGLLALIFDNLNISYYKIVEDKEVVYANINDRCASLERYRKWYDV